MNVSIGGTSSSSSLQSAVNYAWNKGAVVFAAAMNNANSTPTYPAACQNAVAVSATTESDTLASYSSYGTWVDLSAPGSSIYTTSRGAAMETGPGHPSRPL
jgi:thermitase